MMWWCKVRVRQNCSQIDASCPSTDSRLKQIMSDRLNLTKKYGRTSALWLIGGLTAWCSINTGSLRAQIAPDDTVGTEVNSTDNVTEITGGTEVDSNLFHSFQDFSVETDNTAHFNNASNISNIISRVTGGNLSSIDGLIKANGNANLILINPSGISFGNNASLDIGGSFLGSTADSAVFGDGTVFSATEVEAEPMLTVTAPVGLQLGQNSAAIEVTGSGYDLSVANPVFSQVIFEERSGLRVESDRTLALLGGEITIDGGTLAAPGGIIELGSVAEGIVNIDFADNKLNLSYENTNTFGNIQLRSQSLADASGTRSIPGGSIQVRGRELALNDGSLLLVQNLADSSAGTIEVNAERSVTIKGTNEDATVRSSIKNETLGTGRGGDIRVTTSQLTVNNGAAINATTLQPANARGGNIEIDASESIQVAGFSTINSSILSFTSTSSFGAGDAGNINFSTGKLTVLDGARVGAGALGTGSGGDINIEATESVEVIGAEPRQSAASLVGASSLGGGNAGNTTIETTKLVLRDGGRVDSSAAAVGSAGNINIQASDSIEISGQTTGTNEPSSIGSGANIEDEIARRILQLPDLPSGDAGNVTIATGALKITNQAEVSVVNDGLGDAGELRINADSIFLDVRGSILADTESGEGGNIFLNAENITWRGASFTSATAAGTGNGGNITINSDSLIALENSRITADAFQGTGGNIQIDTQGLFVCGECQITASSSLGVDGVVYIETLEPATFDSLDIFQQLTQPEEVVALACLSPSQASASRLTITGRGGVPDRPQDPLSPKSIVTFDDSATQAERSPLPDPTLPPPARNWYKNTEGTVVLTAQATNTTSNNSAFTEVDCMH